MNMTTRLVLRHFLLKTRNEISNTKVAQIDPFFQSFFTQNELKNILCSIYDAKALKELKLGAMSKPELLETIGDDTLILGYFLDLWDEEICQNASITAKGVCAVLDQLSLQSHYLRFKQISEWDSYDLSNYRSLQLKAGKICRVYGIYDAGTQQEEINSVTSPPKRFYESSHLADIAMKELVNERQFQENDLHILSLIAGR